MRSGEWIASDWPVCAVAEMTNPQRMGAALTYARRYALFTLVGIAGEDDLDCPDLLDDHGSVPGSPVSPVEALERQAQRLPTRNKGNGPDRGLAREPKPAILAPENSVALRERLLSEVQNLQSADAACAWAQTALAEKNRLAAEDAKVVEEAFEQKLKGLGEAPGAEISGGSPLGVTSSTDAAAKRTRATETSGNPKAGADQGKIDKSVLTLPEPRRYRNREHLRFVAKQPCLVCGRKPSDPHHLRFMQPRALGSKVSDEFAVPLCRVHHRSAHRATEEPAWWQTAGIDPVKAAHKLWKQTRLSEGDVPNSPQGGPSLDTAGKSPLPPHAG